MIICRGNICHYFLLHPLSSLCGRVNKVHCKIFPMTGREEQGDEAITVDGSLMDRNGGGDMHSGTAVTVRV